MGVLCVTRHGVKGFAYASVYSDPSSDPWCGGFFHCGIMEALSNFWILRFWFSEQAPTSHGGW